MDQITLGQTIANARKKKTWTQEELAEKCRISTRTLQRIETGKVNPRQYTLNCLIDILEIPKEEIGLLYANLKGKRSFAGQCRRMFGSIFAEKNVYTTA
ncbi:helix-turn-helix transcriptional regulator [bacterium]|nr:helix-turn-helix transcriptional regulator [bacterium]